MLGATLPFKQGRASADDLAKAFDRMAQSVTDRQAKRLYEEPESQRRSLMLGFPAQLQSLRARLMRLIDGAFLGGDMPGGVLRGFYLTSGVQEGAPLDRILSSMADVYDRPAQPSQQGRKRQGLFPEPADDRGDVRRTRACSDWSQRPTCASAYGCRLRSASSH